MSPYCSAHDEWLIMKLCMYVGYHDTNNVSHFSGDPIKFKTNFYSIILSVRRHVAILLGTWWMADYETLHVCRVPWYQQCVKFWWWPSDPIKLKKTFYSIICVCPKTYCSVHDEWLIMKLCMYVGYHDTNNVSNFGGDPVTQLNLKKHFIVLFVSVRRHIARCMMNGWLWDFACMLGTMMPTMRQILVVTQWPN